MTDGATHSDNIHIEYTSTDSLMAPVTGNTVNQIQIKLKKSGSHRGTRAEVVWKVVVHVTLPLFP